MRCKALKPTSDSRLQDFLGTLQSFEAYLRFQPALIFPLAASRQLRRALTIRYRDSSVDSNIPGTRGCSPSPGWGCGLGDSDGRWAPENSDSIHYTKWLGVEWVYGIY